MTFFDLNSTRLLAPLLTIALLIGGCDSTSPGAEDDDTDISVPSAYSFDSRYEEDTSAIAYPGQVTRNLLTTDLKIQIDGLASDDADPVSEADLLTRYEYNDQTLNILRSTDPEAKQQTYPDIATGKSLSGKATASYSSEDLIASDALASQDQPVPADELIRDYLKRIAENSSTDQLGSSAVYTTQKGVNMSQFVNKLLLGAVVYSQGTAKYLSDELLMEAKNDGPRRDGEPFSELEHLWDEAYGYFGAARNFKDFLNYQTDDGLDDTYRDVDGDGAIDFESEYNFTYASYAAERSAATENDTDFARTAFEAFVKGRTDIVNDASIDDILEHRDAARNAWEKVVAANVVHYLNSTESDLSDLSDSETISRSNVDSDELNEHWAEGKVFAWVLQYNPKKKLSDTELEDLHTRLGGAPPYGETKRDAVDDLNAAKSIVQSAYGFSDANMSAW